VFTYPEYVVRNIFISPPLNLTVGATGIEHLPDMAR